MAEQNEGSRTSVAYHVYRDGDRWRWRVDSEKSKGYAHSGGSFPSKEACLADLRVVNANNAFLIYIDE
jgi:hypothetical protein